ncbi:MAG: hypothetical protein ACFE9Q_16445 [Candidatus Hodarchaeota archaeon]
MIRRKKEIKPLSFAILFVITILLSTTLLFSNFIPFQNDKLDKISKEGNLDDKPEISNLNLTNPIIGSGINQNVRIYANNISENLLDNENFFEIPSLSSENMYLTYADFNFEFQNNFTTNYIIEGDDALNATNFISFDYKTSQGYSNITIINGTSSDPDFSYITDGSNSTAIHINAPNGLINFTIFANFTGTKYTSGVITGDVKFDRSKILGLFLSIVYELDEDVNLTVSVKDISQPTWKEVISSLTINSSLGIKELKDKLINENLNFIDLYNTTYIQFIFERADHTPFEAWLYNFNMNSTYAFDLPITNSTYVALEFDLLGKKSTVNGFYAWIRTLDLDEATTTKLNITLYRANTTIVRDDDNLRKIYLGPNYNQLIDSIEVTYTGDNVSYFGFNIVNTGNLNVSNYFIVIKSNNSKQVYSLVTLPYYNYGDDGSTEHQLKTTINDGISWINAKTLIPSTITPYSSGQLDASKFKLNVTRGYKPSDFDIDGISTLVIQDIPIENDQIQSFPYNESSYLEWGIGKWSHNFSIPIENDTFNKFRIDLLWNKTNIKGFKFNVKYSVNSYWIDDALTTYTAYYDTDPQWLYTYDLNKSNYLFDNWTFFEFWYIYPDFLTAHNLTNPSNIQILPQTSGEGQFDDNPRYNRIIVQNSLTGLDGLYSLNLTSYNFIQNMNSFINYNGILWETKGFMYGDNISVRVGIQDHNLNAPLSGNANVTLFYPNGTTYLGARLNDSIGFIDESTLYYDFGNQTILDLTNTFTEFGKYYLGFFWSNGSAISCKKIHIYLDKYDIELYRCEYSSIKLKNILDGETKHKVSPSYTLFIASYNDTTGISQPNFYPIENEDVNSLFSYTIGDQLLPVLVTSFKQSENILNPNETINIKTSIRNLHPFIPTRVKVNVKLVSYINNEWIIAEKTSNNVILNFSGHQDDSNEFDVNLKIPNLDLATNTWMGVNAPIRLGGARTIITIFIEDNIAGTYESSDFSLLSNKTSTNFDGHILGLRVTEEVTSRSIFNEFARNECLYLPNKTLFLVNIIDQNYVSSYHQFTGEFSLKLNSEFTNITIDPSTPIKGQSFNLSSTLATEFGEKLIDKNVTCQYNEEGLWVDVSSDLTDSNGTTAFLINTLNIDFEGNLLVKLSWNGDSVNGISRNISINIIHQENNISISIISRDVLIYRNKDTTINFNIKNVGDSTLKVFENISIEINNNLSYSIVEIDYLTLDKFVAGASTNLIVQIAVGYVNTLEISILIRAQNIITTEYILISKDASFKTYDIPIYDYFIKFFIIIIIGVFTLIWITAILYARRIKRRLEIPIEEPIKKRPRKERYVPVSELKKPAPVKKALIKKETPKEEEKEKTDLDSLLEERGLVDKNEKPKE